MSLHAEENPFDTNTEAQWISLSDLMTGLMMVFLLIAVAYMIKIESDVAKTRQVAVVYQEVRHDLYKDLVKDFDKDLPGWGAEITKDLAVRFNEPDVQFNTGKADLKPRFQQILADFFPRYVKIITADKYKGAIQEIRVEGHTSSTWNGAATQEDAYYNNMELSQARTRSTLRYILGLPGVEKDSDWLRSHVTANGLSSSHPIKQADGTEDMARSQRVEFRIRTDADSKIATIVGPAAAKQ